MGALRKAGVWLGLVEDDDDLEYDDAPAESYSRYRDRDRGTSSRRAEERRDRFDDFDDDEELDVTPVRRRRPTRLEADDTPAEPVASPRSAVEARLEQARAERATVRPITRPVSAAPAAGTGTRENLALAPQPQPLQRVAPAAEDDRRTQITTLHPTTYNEARQIGERFRDGSPVIMNLTEMDEADAKRLVDFAAGLAFGLRGTIERVTNRVFLLSPANVQVTAEDKAKIAEGGFLNHS
ncbi:cell division protein SepF [Allorhizocola rhizosphaerae]|uniref:cell division protein SepF n=1 Tax=Allorhizocola rhizosphaerae TaxID=1872709 RepID=UPI000E3D2C96|nr:cell division protein SepF [Allorhizocola rhizosphaerae]